MRILILLTAIALLSCKTSKDQTNFENWKNCLEKSNLTDLECIECDELYNYGNN